MVAGAIFLEKLSIENSTPHHPPSVISHYMDSIASFKKHHLLMPIASRILQRDTVGRRAGKCPTSHNLGS
jgi:hypothetical protein